LKNSDKLLKAGYTMKILKNIFPLFICALLFFSASGCAGKIKYTVRGQVADGESGKAVEGAVIAFRWFGFDHWPPGFEGSRNVDFYQDETVSDAGGRFEIPAFRFTECYMGVYKKGYVCWMSDKIFPGWKPRRDFEVKDGMSIRLEPFKDSYSKTDHARFTVFGMDVCVGVEGGRGTFERAIRHFRK